MRDGRLWREQEEDLRLEPRSLEPQKADFSSADTVLATADEMRAKEHTSCHRCQAYGEGEQMGAKPLSSNSAFPL